MTSTADGASLLAARSSLPPARCSSVSRCSATPSTTAAFTAFTDLPQPPAQVVQVPAGLREQVTSYGSSRFAGSFARFRRWLAAHLLFAGALADPLDDALEAVSPAATRSTSSSRTEGSRLVSGPIADTRNRPRLIGRRAGAGLPLASLRAAATEALRARDLTVDDVHGPVGVVGDPLVVGDDDRRRAAALHLVADEADDLVAELRVEG